MLNLESYLPQVFERFDVSKYPEFYSGKVRDAFNFNGKKILLTSDRLSAFDKVLTTIPFKGEVLNRIANFWFDHTRSICPNHIISAPHPNIFVCEELKILPIEVVVRGYLTGSAWRDHVAGKDISGIKLATHLKKNHKFETPIITPTTKAGKDQHDQPIPSAEILKNGIIDRQIWEEITEKALALFNFGTRLVAERGLILVDTKYEFGLNQDGKLMLADEIHTPDSSRYWLESTYLEAYDHGKEPYQLDKEFVRAWLLDHEYSGEGTPPEFTSEFRVKIAQKYLELYDKLIGEPFPATCYEIDINEILATEF